MKLEEKVFGIIAEAGDAKSDIMYSLKKIKEGNYNEARTLISQSSKKLESASKIHIELLSEAMNSKDENTNFLVVHSEDHYSNAVFAQSLVSELIDIFEIIDPRNK
ncbi:Phosphotransferase system cellobiose-specific component IIA [Clostridium cavendishii DSM 21758]|uniref:Phosphotransferase system cellobiose-specific component IIA n=1 Tax=Clostridium cavendishii DSM 21758 TaxID=1121302 RepID=A0A1M6QEX0_9CLOT|nr:PTS lactose/cellobiose transporter subunit IIA [Clostridium cavendishii]SHK18597.1 Phosphotransferase system cellobiose-specific component IIA [Clostridium cavendishii DSM 21758]